MKVTPPADHDSTKLPPSIEIAASMLPTDAFNELPSRETTALTGPVGPSKSDSWPRVNLVSLVTPLP